MIFRILIVLYGLHALPAQGRWAECSSDSFNGTNVNWCIFPTDRTKNPKVIYHFHGMGGDEHLWAVHYGAALEGIWLAEGRTLPTVVTVSFGRQWVLSEVASTGNRYRVFLDQVFPLLENKIGPVLPQDRYLVGESMGGLNGAQLLSKNTELFSKYALLCPAFTTIGPHSSDAEVDDYILRTGADFPIVKYLIKWAKEEFPTPADWDAHDPFALLARTKTPIPPVFLSVGTIDNFGFTEGTALYYHQLVDKGVTAFYETVPLGKHCVLNVPKLAQFLSSDWN